MARAARAAGAALVGFSTDYVFAGDDPAGYDERSPVGAAQRLRRHQARRRARAAGRAPRGLRRAHGLGLLAPRPQLPAHDAAPRRRARRAARRRRPDRLPDGDAAPRARDARPGRALRARHLPPRRRRLDELARLRERDHGGRRAGGARRPDPVERAAAAGAAAAPARSCEPCTPTPHGCHTGETGCATVSPPWPTRRERETDPRDRRLRVHRLAFRAAPARGATTTSRS